MWLWRVNFCHCKVMNSFAFVTRFHGKSRVGWMRPDGLGSDTSDVKNSAHSAPHEFYSMVVVLHPPGIIYPT